MKLSAPVYRLKRQARLLARQENIPHHKALDRVAQQEGFESWSLLAKRLTEDQIGRQVIDQLQIGDLLLVGARPGHGKTLLSLEVAIAAMQSGQKSVFFSLDYSLADIAASFTSVGANMSDFKNSFEFDGSNDICAPYMIEQLHSAPIGTVVVIDYLQLLDQQRQTPPLLEQITSLRAFARERGLIFVFVSQIERAFDEQPHVLPGLSDVHLPNPLDLTLFDKSCFLRDGHIELQAHH